MFIKYSKHILVLKHIFYAILKFFKHCSCYDNWLKFKTPAPYRNYNYCLKYESATAETALKYFENEEKGRASLF